jgi:hypothetical protein
LFNFFAIFLKKLLTFRGGYANINSTFTNSNLVHNIVKSHDYAEKAERRQPEERKSCFVCFFRLLLPVETLISNEVGLSESNCLSGRNGR